MFDITRVILSRMLKDEATKIRETDAQKSAFLLKMSKDVLSEGPIESKLANIRHALGPARPAGGVREALRRQAGEGRLRRHHQRLPQVLVR